MANPHNYVYHAYPSKRYHPTLGVRRVTSAEEDEALCKEDARWTDSPANFGVEAEEAPPEITPEEAQDLPSGEPANEDEAEEAAENEHPFTIQQVQRMNKSKLLDLAGNYYSMVLPADEADITVAQLKEMIVARIKGE